MVAPVGRISLFAGLAAARAGLADETWPPEVAATLPIRLLELRPNE
jgi:hypothetical protein